MNAPSRNGPQQPQPEDAKSIIQIVFTAKGEVVVQCQGIMTRPLFNMLIETAKQDFLGILIDAEKKAQSAIAIAPPGLQVQRNEGKGG